MNQETTVTARINLPYWITGWLSERWPDVDGADRLWLQACVRNFEGAADPATGVAPVRRADFVGTDADLWSVDQGAYCFKLAEDSDTGPLDGLFDWINESGEYVAEFEIPVSLPAPGFTPGYNRDVLVHVGLVGVFGGGATFLKDKAGRQLTAGQTVRVPNSSVDLLDPEGGWRPQYISGAPAMPSVQLRAALRDLPEGTATVDWSYRVEYSLDKRGPPRTGVCTFSETQAVAVEGPVTFVEWNVPFRAANADCQFANAVRDGGDVQTEWLGGPDVFIGGVATPSVRVTALGGDVLDDEVAEAYEIRGQNPGAGAVKATTTLYEQVKIYAETIPKWGHFRDESPSYGPPNGFGLMQLDQPHATETALWNWRANLEEGRVLIREKQSLACTYLDRIRGRNPSARPQGGGPVCNQVVADNLAEQLVWTETFQRYNGGAYWEWVPQDRNRPGGLGGWRERSDIPTPRGQTVPQGRLRWQLLQDVRAGNYPQGWNP